MQGVDIPMTLISTKAVEDITKLLEDIQKDNKLPDDLMCIIVSGISAHFERKRADSYANALISKYAQLEKAEKELDNLKKASELFEGVADNDHTDN